MRFDRYQMLSDAFSGALRARLGDGRSAPLTARDKPHAVPRDRDRGPLHYDNPPRLPRRRSRAALPAGAIPARAASSKDPHHRSAQRGRKHRSVSRNESLIHLINIKLLCLLSVRCMDESHAPPDGLHRSPAAAPAARPMTKPLPVPNDAETFDAAAEAARLRAQTRARRRPRYGRSRLDRHKHELLALRDAGATTAEIRRWLRRHGAG